MQREVFLRCLLLFYYYSYDNSVLFKIKNMKKIKFTPEEKAHPSVWVMRYGWLMANIQDDFIRGIITITQYIKYRDMLSKARMRKFI